MTFFSKLGQDIILPQDVLIQSKETAAIPDAINATIGIATKNKKALFLPTIDRIIKELNIKLSMIIQILTKIILVFQW